PSILHSCSRPPRHLTPFPTRRSSDLHPAAGNWSGTLLNGLLSHHAGAAALPRAGIVHRLDKDTSGLMVVGKTTVAVTALVRAIADRKSTRLNSSHVAISYAVFCLKKK